MSASPRLALPFIAPSQAQKHVTHNEALQQLDALVQLVLEELGAETPPATPANGAIWALGPAPTGAWAGQAGMLAQWADPAWLFFTPQEGWRGWDAGHAAPVVYQAGAWTPVALDLDNLDGVGIGTTSDSTNRLALASEASLFSHAGAGHQIKVNKSAAGDTASLLFQTGWSGRAEMGTAGSDDFAIKLSADGSAWTTALSFDPASGLASGAAVTQSSEDSSPGRLMRTGDGGVLGPAVTLNGTTALQDRGLTGGTYVGSAGAISGFPESASYFHSVLLSQRNGGFYSGLSIRNTGNPAAQKIWFGSGGSAGSPVAWTELWHRANTTVDTNGFVKEASPIVRLFDDGTEEPADPVGGVFSKQGTGHYELAGVAGLASRGWQIEVPQDANGNRIVFVETAYDAALRVMTIRTSEVAWRGAWVAGAPRDIPAGRWVDLRFDSFDTGGDETV